MLEALSQKLFKMVHTKPALPKFKVLVTSSHLLGHVHVHLLRQVADQSQINFLTFCLIGHLSRSNMDPSWIISESCWD